MQKVFNQATDAPHVTKDLKPQDPSASPQDDTKGSWDDTKGSWDDTKGSWRDKNACSTPKNSLPCHPEEPRATKDLSTVWAT